MVSIVVYQECRIDTRQEGYDYFPSFHDIDMLPEDDSCDYSYPNNVEHFCPCKTI